MLKIIPLSSYIRSSLQPADQTPPIQSDKYKCRIDTVISPDDGHMVAPEHVEKRNKYTKQNCAPTWIHLQDCTRMHGQQNVKFSNTIRHFSIYFIKTKI